MSYRYSNAVEWLKPLSSDKVKRVLDFLANHSDKRGVVYASYETLMRAAGITKRQVISDALNELRGLHILGWNRRPNQCNKYLLSMEAIVAHSLPGRTPPKLKTETPGRTLSQLEREIPGRTPAELETGTLSSCRENLQNNNGNPQDEKWFDPQHFNKPITTPSGITYSTEEVHRVLYWIFRDPKCPNKWYRQNIHSVSGLLKFFPKMAQLTRPHYVIPTATQIIPIPTCPTCGGTGEVDYVKTEDLPNGGTHDYYLKKDCVCVTKVIVEV